MKDLSPNARHVLDIGRGAGEPTDAALSRTRASLMRRVGSAAASAVAVTAVATTAKATSASVAPVAAAAAAPAIAIPTVAVPVAAPVVAAPMMAAPAVASVPLAATPFVVKVALAVALATSVGGGVVYRTHAAGVTQATPSVTTSHAPAKAPARTAAAMAPAPTLDANPVADVADVSPLVAAPAAPVAAAEAPRPPRARAEVPAQWAVVAPPAAPASSPAPAPSSLAEDVASLREAQASLIAGDPRHAFEAADRVHASGPLAEEREGIQILASCALGSTDAKTHAQRFVDLRPQAPIALRVRAACIDPGPRNR